MADTAALQSYLSNNPAFKAAWQKLQQDVVSGDQQAQQSAREAFGYTVQQLLHGKVQNPQDYVVNPSTGQVMYQPDHSVRNNLLLLGGMLAMPGGSSLGGGAAAAAAPALGPSTPASMAATSAVVGGSTVPSSLAATGGTLSSVGGYFKTAKDVGDALTSISGGRVAGREAETRAAYGQNQNIIDLYRAQQDAANSENTYGLNKANTGVNIGNLDLNQKQFTLDAPGKRASNSVRGDILANAQDATATGISPNIPVPQISGGLRPSMFSDNTRALGGEISSQALASQRAGDTFAPLPTIPDYVKGPTAPGLTDIPQPGRLDSILNVAGSVGSLAGLMGSIPYFRKKGAY